MGIGDEVMATGLARGAADRGKRIAFGDGRKLIWGPWCKEAFKNNPNIARQADGSNIEWIRYYKGHRGYNKLDSARRRWIWNYDFKATPGEFFFDQAEQEWIVSRPGTVLVEPNVPWHKSVAVNKDWGAERWQVLTDKLTDAGWIVIQPGYGDVRLEGAHLAPTTSFRVTAALAAGVDLVICPEGGLHHACAAVATKAIVIFGGFVPPAVLGYESQISLTGNAQACGSLDRCDHCRKALDRIDVDGVFTLANAELDQKNSTAAGRTH